MIPIAILLTVLGYINYRRVTTIKEKINTEQDENVKAKLTKKMRTTTLSHKVMFVCAIVLFIASLIFKIAD